MLTPFDASSTCRNVWDILERLCDGSVNVSQRLDDYIFHRNACLGTKP
jgi:hypothetical protein